MDNNANYFVVFVLGVCLFDCALSAPEVRLSVGIVRGSDKQAVTTLKPYHAYYGVPFAEPPTGPLRFKPTVRIAPSDPNRIISSDGFRARCAQSQTVFSQTSQSQQKPQSEDCLYLNIFTPDAPNGRFDLGNGRQKKVLLWIHGGGFVAGSADTFSPARMVTDYDVIVVTIQYRVGILGFLSSEDDNLPGNLALRDSLEAIRWTKDFIGEFGGDGSDITVFGQSAGSALVSILSISPLSKGLFTKAIMISGTASAHWAVNENPEESFYQLAQDTGCRPWFYFPGIKNLYNRRIVDCLEKLPVDSLLNEGDSVFEDNGFSGNSQGGGGGGGGGGFSGNAQGGGGGFSGNSQGGGGLSGNSQGGGFSGNSQGGGFPGQGERPVDTSLFDGSSLKPIPYRPVVDGDLLPRDPKTLLSDVDYLKQNGVLDRKYIVGANNNEATIRYLFIYSIFGSDFPPEFVDRDVIERSDKAETYKVFGLPVTSDVVSYVDLMYNYPQDSQGMAPIQGRFDIVTDTNYVVPTIQFANSLLSASPETEVYLFLFDYYPELKDKNSPLKGSAHGTNTYYIFDEAPEKSESLLSYANVYTPSAIPIMRYYRSLFTNLANFGSPAGSGNTPWPRYTLEEQKYLAIDEVAEVRERMYGHRVSLWTEFLPRQYKSILSNRNK